MRILNEEENSNGLFGNVDEMNKRLKEKLSKEPHLEKINGET